LDVQPVALTLPRLMPAFEGYRIVQISDFHIGTWLNRRRLEEAVHQVNQQHPDLIAITGDFVTYAPERFAQDLIDCLGQLRARDGAFAVLGNHDHWTDPQILRQIFHKTGVIELPNTFQTIRRGPEQLHIAGVDDVMNEKACLPEVLAGLPEEGAAILMAHEPDFADVSAASGRFDLQISGHTHGGQILLPRMGPPFLPRFGRKYPSGLYQINGMVQYTNRGLGTAELQFRLNCRPEITVFNLHTPTGDRSLT